MIEAEARSGRARRRPGRGLADGAEHRRAARPVRAAPGSGGGVSDDFARRLPALGPAPQGEGRHQAQSKRGAFGEELVGEALAGRAGALPARRPPGARPRPTPARARCWTRRRGGRVRARVQGSRPKPYDVTIGVEAAVDATSGSVSRRCCRARRCSWRSCWPARCRRTSSACSSRRGCRSSRTRMRDLETDCSCPDVANPCKHIAAVYYLLGEEFDRDPFLIFRLRGMTREELLRVLEEMEAGRASRPRARTWRSVAADDPRRRRVSLGRRAERELLARGCDARRRLPGAAHRREARGSAASGWARSRSGAVPSRSPNALLPVYERASGRGAGSTGRPDA